MDDRTFISLCLLCGDEGLTLSAPDQPRPGIPILDRLLYSVVDRSDGKPLVDEIVIGWNGSKQAEFDRIIAAWRLTRNLVIKVVPFKWEGNFAKARQMTFEAASGIWRGYLDTDDLLPQPGDLAIEQSFKSEGLSVPEGRGGEAKSFKQHLLELPKHINAEWWPYHYVIEPDGTCFQRHWHSRWVRWGDGWVWTENVHEDMVPIHGNRAGISQNAGMPVLHYPTVSLRDRLLRNLEILRKMEADTEKHKLAPDFRLLYGLGTAFKDLGEPVKACDYLHRAIDCALTDVDCMMACLVFAEAKVAMNDAVGATWAALRAINLYPQQQEGYYALAEARHLANDYSRAAYWYEIGASTPIKAGNMLIHQPFIRSVLPKIIAARSYLQMGNSKRALELAAEALQVRKNDPLVRQLWHEAKRAQLLVTAVQAVQDLTEYLIEQDEVELAAELLALGLPNELRQHPIVRAMRRGLPDAKRAVLVPEAEAVFEKKCAAELGGCLFRLDELMFNESSVATFPAVVAEPMHAPGEIPGRQALTPERLIDKALNTGLRLEEVHVKQDSKGVAWTVGKLSRGPRPTADVTFFCPVHTELWGPENPRTVGIGASEEAVVYLSEELAKLGVNVEVFAPKPDPDIWITRGVRWRHLREFDHRGVRPLIISHRTTWLAAQPDLGAARVVDWHQDNWYPESLWGKRAADAAQHVFVSAWQANELMKSGKIDRVNGWLLPNAVPDEHFLGTGSHEEPIARDLHRVIWASNPTRGLNYLLSAWPEIKLAVPEAKLVVFYGWELVMALARAMQSTSLAQVRADIDASIEQLKDQDVIWGGRIGQNRLFKEMLASGVMAYTPWEFHEGFCVALSRATAAGMIPVFPANGALPETQPAQKYMIKNLEWARGARAELTAAVIEALNDQSYDRVAASKLVLTWSATAKLWMDQVICHDRSSEIKVDQGPESPKPEAAQCVSL